MTRNDIEKIEGFECTISELKKIIDKCKNMNIEIPKRFIVYLQMKENRKLRNRKVKEWKR